MSLEIAKKIYKKILYGYKGTSDGYKRYLRKKGVTIGKNVSFYEPNTNYIDTQKGCLITIGNNVEITRGVTIISHDYSWSVIKKLTGEIIGSRGRVKIGNNVFIGMNTTILEGVEIGDNVIIGAGSIVNKNIENGVVAAGVPCKKIGTVDSYIEKRKKDYNNDAKELFKSYYLKYGTCPNEDIFDEFFWIFKERNPDELSRIFKEKMKLCGNYEETMNAFKSTKPIYNGYEEFKRKCLEELDNEK